MSPARADPVGAVLRDYLRGESDALAAVLTEPDSLVDPLSVHRCRVAARRLRGVLGAYADHAPAAPGLRSALRRLGRTLGDLRGLDVLAERFAEDPDLSAELARQREAALSDAVDALTSPWTSEVLGRVNALLAGGGWSSTDSAVAGEAVLGHEMARVRRRAARAESAAEAALGAGRGASPDAGRDAALHEVRKAAKRLRYSADVVAEHVAGAAATSDRARAVQDVLGAHNDVVAARAWLAGLVGRRPDLTIPELKAADPAAGDAALAELLGA